MRMVRTAAEDTRLYSRRPTCRRCTTTRVRSLAGPGPADTKTVHSEPSASSTGTQQHCLTCEPEQGGPEGELLGGGAEVSHRNAMTTWTHTHAVSTHTHTPLCDITADTHSTLDLDQLDRRHSLPVPKEDRTLRDSEDTDQFVVINVQVVHNLQVFQERDVLCVSSP